MDQQQTKRVRFLRTNNNNNRRFAFKFFGSIAALIAPK